MNRKGVESFPFYLFLTIIIAVFVLTISFYQIGLFSEFTAKKEITDGYKRLVNAIENLRSTSDQGSFTRVSLNIPNDFSLVFSLENDTITIDNGVVLVNEIEADLLATTFNNTLKAGNYEIVVYYGQPANETLQPYTLYFI